MNIYFVKSIFFWNVIINDNDLSFFKICHLADIHVKLTFLIYVLIKIQVRHLGRDLLVILNYFLGCFICATCDGVRIFNVEPLAQKCYLGKKCSIDFCLEYLVI